MKVSMIAVLGLLVVIFATLANADACLEYCINSGTSCWQNCNSSFDSSKVSGKTGVADYQKSYIHSYLRKDPQDVQLFFLCVEHYL